MPEYTIVNNGENAAGLVSGLKILLNATNANPRSPLPINDTLDRETLTRALTASTLYNYGDSSGTVSTRTLVNLTKRFRSVLLADPTAMTTLPAWLGRIARAGIGNGISSEHFGTDQFLAMYKENFRIYMPPGNAWEDNFRRFVNFIFADTRITDRRVASYIMATAMHEGRAAADRWKATWNPVSETNGEARDYGALQTVVDWENDPLDAQGNEIAEVTDRAQIQQQGRALINIPKRGRNRFYPRAQILQKRYYGRGYVQITFQENYRAMDEALGLNNRLLCDPELAVTDAQVSYNSSSYGIVNGSFSGPKRRVAGRGFVDGYKIADYVNATQTDYFNAREIVNGDKNRVETGSTISNGRKVANYCETFQAMFDAALA